MKIIRSVQEIALRNVAASKYLALGVFDGIHLGHQKIINDCVSQAHEAGALAVVFTFRNHPLDVLAPAYAPKKLILLSEKLRLLRDLGVDVTVCVKFDRAFARLEPGEFVRRVLVGRCAMNRLYCGYNFRFGRNATGTTALIRRFAHTYGFSVRVIPPVYADGMIVSSSKIRELIEDGMVGVAARMLTRPYQVQGHVIRGAGRGTRLGFPTANLLFPRQLLIPAEGVYAVRVERAVATKNSGKVSYSGMLYIGKCPTFGGKKRSVEVHLFDFRQNLVGERLQVAFVERLRADHRFESPDALVAQQQKDEYAARRILNAGNT
jgi:riboflavin kinase/FMN adenylyltransferase